VKHDDPLEPCAEALGKLYEVLGELNSVSDPVSTAVMKLRIQEKIYSGVSSIIEDVKPGAYKALDRYTPEEMLMAASILERASDEGLGAVMAYTNHKFGEKGNKVLRDLIEMDIIRYRMESVIGLGDTLRLRVMANDPSLAKHIVGGKISIIDFSAEWCGPCKKMGAVLDSVKKESDDVAVFKIDVDEETELAEKYGISGVPFAVIFGKDRKPLEAMSGFPGEEALRRSIEAARA
jgi:thioredoxin 1